MRNFRRLVALMSSITNIEQKPEWKILKTLTLAELCSSTPIVLAHPGAISRLASFNVHSTVERINTVEIAPPPDCSYTNEPSLILHRVRLPCHRVKESLDPRWQGRSSFIRAISFLPVRVPKCPQSEPTTHTFPPLPGTDGEAFFISSEHAHFCPFYVPWRYSVPSNKTSRKFVRFWRIDAIWPPYFKRIERNCNFSCFTVSMTPEPYDKDALTVRRLRKIVITLFFLRGILFVEELTFLIIFKVDHKSVALCAYVKGKGLRSLKLNPSYIKWFISLGVRNKNNLSTLPTISAMLFLSLVSNCCSIWRSR